MLQFDAHADLRDGYLGEHYSHAAAMRRVLDHAGRLARLGRHPRHLARRRRSSTRPTATASTIHWAKDQARWDIEEIVAPLAGPPGLRDLRHRCAGCRRHAGDGHADARRARLLAGARDPAARLRGRATSSAPTSSSSPRSRACTPTTTRRPRWPTRCCPTRWRSGPDQERGPPPRPWRSFVAITEMVRW